MSQADDLAYLRSKMGDERFADWISGIADELRKLEHEDATGNGRVELGHMDVHQARVVDVWRQPRPIRYRSKSA